MTSADLAPSTLAAMIIVDGAIPAVIAPQDIAGQLPIAPRNLAAHEREALGLADPGVTMAYKAGAIEVFLDLGGSHATVWYNGADWREALVTFEERMRQRFPQAEILTDDVNSGDGKMRVRHYRVQSRDGAAVADLRLTYPAPRTGFSQSDLFLVRVFAQRRGAVQ